MLVSERMSKDPVIVSPDISISDALNLMRTKRVRRLPVVQYGKLAGIISEQDLLNASPSSASSLSIWEMNYLLNKITVKEVMTKNVFTVSEDTPVEEAARLMADNKIGGLPVVRGKDKELVGIITETDLFKVFLEFMGAREHGVRVSAMIKDERGQLAKISAAVTKAGGNFVAFGTFKGPEANTYQVTFKVNDLNQDQISEIVTPLVLKVMDIRTL